MTFTYLHLDEFGAIVYLENGTAHNKVVLKMPISRPQVFESGL